MIFVMLLPVYHNSRVWNAISRAFPLLPVLQSDTFPKPSTDRKSSRLFGVGGDVIYNMGGGGEPSSKTAS